MGRFTFVSKPVQVEAIAFSELDNVSTETKAFPSWLVPAIIAGTIQQQGEAWVCKTKNGFVAINPTDMLIKLADGEIYPCDIGVFKNKYEAVAEAE